MIRLLAVLTCFIPFFSFGQGNNVFDEMRNTEEKLVASTKQLNQFFRRFNGEEDEKGNRYYKGDKKFHDEGLRKKYIPSLFDQSNNSFNSSELRDFARESVKKPVYLSLRDEGLVAEVNAIFLYKGSSVNIQMFMRIQQQRQGYEWVIDDIFFAGYSKYFDKDTTENKPFIHPMSHEMGFMNFRKAFLKNPESYTMDDYEPDYLTLFLYDLNNGQLKFETVKDTKYHFFGVDGWYFEVANYNRPGYNTGWLISNLTMVNSLEKDYLKKYIYGKL